MFIGEINGSKFEGLYKILFYNTRSHSNNNGGKYQNE